jgi:hypothetical protein
MLATLDRWRIQGGEFMPPELNVLSIVGIVNNHPTHQNGKTLVISGAVKVEGNHIFTEDGTEYRLLQPHPDYVKWCEEQGVWVPTDENPIKVTF